MMMTIVTNGAPPGPFEGFLEGREYLEEALNLPARSTLRRRLSLI